MVKNPPANAGDIRDASSVLGPEDPLEKGMATHSSIPAWKGNYFHSSNGHTDIEDRLVDTVMGGGGRARRA